MIGKIILGLICLFLVAGCGDDYHYNSEKAHVWTVTGKSIYSSYGDNGVMYTIHESRVPERSYTAFYVFSDNTTFNLGDELTIVKKEKH